MGLYSDILASALAIDVELPTEANHRTARIELNQYEAQLDLDIPAAYAEGNEVQELSATASTMGNFTITVTLANGETFTTGNIAFDASAATVETAIDVAATAEPITGWTNGDIAVTGGPADTAPLVFTFDGDSVAGANHEESVAVDVDLDEAVGVFSTTTDGGPDRPALAALSALGCIAGTPPSFGDEGIGSLVAGDANRPNRPSQSLVGLLLREASVQEDKDWVTLLEGIVK